MEVVALAIIVTLMVGPAIGLFKTYEYQRRQEPVGYDPNDFRD